MDARASLRIRTDSDDLCVLLRASAGLADLQLPGRSSVQGLSLLGGDASVARGKSKAIPGSRGRRQAGAANPGCELTGKVTPGCGTCRIAGSLRTRQILLSR